MMMKTWEFNRLQLIKQYSALSLMMIDVRLKKMAAYPKKIHFFTSFDDYEHFTCFYYCLGPVVNELNHQFSSLAPVDQLLLTLIKLRQAKEDVELSFMFDNINICIKIALLMPFLMVPITSSNYIDKWVILGKKVDFSQFSPKVFKGFDSRFQLIPPKCSFMIPNITAVSTL